MMNSAQAVDGTGSYAECRLCPHACKVNRLKGEFGICGEGAGMRIAFAGIHRGEEPPVSMPDGKKGSGTVFFSGCNLQCKHCQNFQISGRHASHPTLGRDVDPAEFAEICKALEEAGAANLNLVTGTHVIPSIIEGLQAARKSGVTLPVVWNTSGYESAEGLALIAPWVDVFLPDIKTLNTVTAGAICNAPDYGEYAALAVTRMAELRPLELFPDGSMRGTIVRHLVLPGAFEDTRQVLKWFAKQLKGRAIISLMVQFVKPFQDSTSAELSALQSISQYKGHIQDDQYDELIDELDALGIEEGFLQELGDELPWIPDFSKRNPFPEEFADPVWNWKEGFV